MALVSCWRGIFPVTQERCASAKSRRGLFGTGRKLVLPGIMYMLIEKESAER